MHIPGIHTRKMSSVPYAPFDTPDPSPKSCGASSSDLAAARLLDGLPQASSIVAAALDLGEQPHNWEQNLRALSSDQIATRLRAADLGGLVEPISRAVGAAGRANERSTTPTLPAPHGADGGMPAPTVAQQSFVGVAPASRVLRFVPHVERMPGRVPRSEEKWQHFEGESGTMGCLRAFRLIMYNITGTFLCLPDYVDAVRRNA